MGEVAFARYVALGDSQTEGLNDGDEDTGFRGWADRLAEHLADVHPQVLYANLAVRGKRIAQVRDEQLQAALDLEPDLATVLAGMNDLIRPRFDPAEAAACLEEMFSALTAAGAHVATFTYPDISRLSLAGRLLRRRVLRFNALIRAAAARHGVTLLDAFAHPVATDPRVWSTDRLHGSPLGHTRFAAGMARALDLPGSDDAWSTPLPPMPPPSGWRVARDEARWVASFVGPWIRRRLRGVSSGDGRSAKRPALTPVTPGARDAGPGH